MKLTPASVKSSLRNFLICGAALFIGACTTTQIRPSGFLSTYDNLKPTETGDLSIYRAPGFELSNFSSIRMVPTVIHTPTERLSDLDPQLQQQVIELIDDQIVLRLTQAKVQPGSEDKALAANRVLVIRAALTDVQTPNRALNILTSLAIAPLTAGGASLELEVVQEQSNLVVMAATCTKRASVLKQFFGAFSQLSHAKYAISECVEQIENVLKGAANSKVDP